MDEFLQNWGDSDELVIAVLVAVAAFAAMKLMPRLVAGVPFVTPADLDRRMREGEDLLVLDVRSPSEFRDGTGHLPGALNVPFENLSQRLAELGPQVEGYRDTPVFVVCRSAGRAAGAAGMLKKKGFGRVHVVTGGMLRWIREKRPTSHA